MPKMRWICALCILPMTGCGLFHNSERVAAPAAPSIERPALTPVSLRPPKVDYAAKTYARGGAPRALLPCFGESPLAGDCRWDGAIDHENNFDDIRDNAQSRKSIVIDQRD